MTREEAIKEIKSWAIPSERGREVLETLIPELAENEDERIRKWLYDFIHNCPNETFEFYGGVGKKAVLAYLEKQKEHIPANSVGLKEQKPAEWSAKGRRGRIGSTPEHIRKKAENFLSKMEPPYDADDICSAYETGAMESIKQEWSEEDETRLTNTLIMLKEYAIHHYSKDDVEKSVDWLENRVKFLHPQPKQEWSYEETKDLVHILKVLDDCYAYGKHDLSKTDHDNLTSTIKSLRPSWKPNEEQMDALDKAIPVCMGVVGRDEVAPLKSLCEQLKKL